MVANPPENMPRITPYLHYRDPGAAIEWLSKAFGLQVRFTMPDTKGGIMHAEMNLHDGVVMLGQASPEHGSKSPLDLDGVNQGLYVYVDDVDAHFRRSKEAGARILMPPEDMFWGDRMYSAADLEGHQWSFGQHVRDVPPEEMKPPENWGG
jgi:PhnB protein